LLCKLPHHGWRTIWLKPGVHLNDCLFRYRLRTLLGQFAPALTRRGVAGPHQDVAKLLNCYLLPATHKVGDAPRSADTTERIS
jgi:hypothetical protein